MYALPVKITCDKCDAENTVDLSAIGKTNKVKCKKCGGKINVFNNKQTVKKAQTITPIQKEELNYNRSRKKVYKWFLNDIEWKVLEKMINNNYLINRSEAFDTIGRGNNLACLQGLIIKDYILELHSGGAHWAYRLTPRGLARCGGLLQWLWFNLEKYAMEIIVSAITALVVSLLTQTLV